MGSLTVAGEMSSSCSSWDGSACVSWVTGDFFQASHSSDTVTLGGMDFLPLAVSKMSLEAEDVNSQSQLPLNRASCGSVNEHPQAFPGSHS